MVLWMALFSWIPIFVNETKITHLRDSKFVALVFSFKIHTKKSQFRWYLNSCIGPSTKIGHSSLVSLIDSLMVS